MRHGKISVYSAFMAFVLLLGLSAGPARGAVGCDLNDPDKDVARLFPGSTGYQAVTIEVQKLGGDRLLTKLESRLRDKLHGLYESIDVPYTLYVIYAKDRKIGYIHGVNQKGRYGGIQIFLALDLEKRIKTFYIQKITGPHGEKLRDAAFGKQFVGLSLADFEQYDVITGKGSGKVPAIRNPAAGPEAEYDFRRILRGTKKNLIFVDEFLRAAPDLGDKSGAPAK